jgi:hypothetical protein
MIFVCSSGGKEGTVMCGEWREISAERTDQLYIAYKKNIYALSMHSHCSFNCESLGSWQDEKGEKVLQSSKHIFHSSVKLNPPHSWCMFVETNIPLEINHTTDSILHRVIHCFPCIPLKYKTHRKIQASWHNYYYYYYYYYYYTVCHNTAKDHMCHVVKPISYAHWKISALEVKRVADFYIMYHLLYTSSLRICGVWWTDMAGQWLPTVSSLGFLGHGWLLTYCTLHLGRIPYFKTPHWRT